MQCAGKFASKCRQVCLDRPSRRWPERLTNMSVKTNSGWVLLFCLLTANQVAAEEAEKDVGAALEAPKKESLWDKVSLGVVWYLHAGGGEEGGETFNRAHISRGYVTLKLKPTRWLQPRVTFDTHQDESGDWKVRLKYMYAGFVLPVDTAFISDTQLEAGIVHTPWFELEEHLNYNRMQGMMFIERNGLLNSADLGVTVSGLLGRELPQEYQDQVNRANPGTWGSFALGVYNGGGYHAVEANANKVFMSRLAVRPLGPWLANLQLAHFFVYGAGNSQAEPQWQLHDIFASFEHEYFVITGQYVLGRGNQSGSRVDSSGNALGYEGWSGFGEMRLPWIDSKIIGRYDYFDSDGDGSSGVGIPRSRVIAGVAYTLVGHNILMLDYDRSWQHRSDTPVDWQVKLTLQIYI